MSDRISDESLEKWESRLDVLNADLAYFVRHLRAERTAVQAVVKADAALAGAILEWLDDRVPEKMGALTTAIMDSAQKRNELKEV